MRYAVAIALLLSFVGASQAAHAQELDGAKLHEACAVRADCRPELRCLNNVCVDEATFDSSQVHVTTADDKNATRGYVGTAFGASLPAVWGQWGEAAQLTLRAGVLVSGAQFQLDVSPGTTVLSNMVASSAAGLFDVTGTVGYLVPLSEMVSWIFRIGGGGGFVFGLPTTPSCPDCGNTFPSAVVGFAEARLDIAGVAIRPSKHVLIEINAPSFRLMFMQGNISFPNDPVLWMWVTNVAVNYVF